ncbi:hypothetical protein PR001_g31417, partial [Phytophthora rubi]
MGKWMAIDNKRELIRKHAATPAMTQAQLAKWAKKEFRLRDPPARNPISDLLRNAGTIMKEAYGQGKRRKPLKVKAPALERRLEGWIEKAEQRGMCLNRKVITRKAKKLRFEVGGPALDVGLSVGWMSAFLNRHELRSRPRHGEAGSAKPDVVRQGRHARHEVTDLYDPQDIYNMDETGLNYKAAPTRSICTSKMPGVKKDKTRITLALTTNADGSDSLPALFIGRAVKPRCFGKKTAEQHGFLYRKTNKAWMNSKVYQEWLLNLDREMRAAQRHILLLVDNVSSHAHGDLVLTNVQVESLPPNTTTHLQPLDAGIIASFKARFKSLQIDQAIDRFDAGEDVDGRTVYKVDQLQAMQWSQELWKTT